MKMGSMEEILEKGSEKEIWVDSNSLKTYVIVDGRPEEITNPSEEEDNFVRFKSVVDRLEVSPDEKSKMWWEYFDGYQDRYWKIKRMIQAEAVRWMGCSVSPGTVELKSKADMVDIDPHEWEGMIPHRRLE